MKNKHLLFNDRLDIEAGLRDKLCFKKIATIIGKDCTTVSKEIKNHIKFESTGAIGKPFNDCCFRKQCKFRIKGIVCDFKHCSYYQRETCSKLAKPPYVCNGCQQKRACTLGKKLYIAEFAQREYDTILVESRQGVTFCEDELATLNEILKPLIAEQGQSIHHAIINNMNKIMCSEKEIYNLIDSGALEIKNIDLPRKVRYRNRKKRKTYYKIDKKCLIGRKYDDFEKWMVDNSNPSLVQMDSVEGKKGGKVLLTLHFVTCSFMVAFIREHNDAQSVIGIFNDLYRKLGRDNFLKLFPVILTDNGSEFSNPKEIEQDHESNQRTKLFYCEPGRSDQKGSCEVNHEMIRKVIAQGKSLDDYTQNDINLLMSHINSYKRKKLNDCSPQELFSFMYGKDITKLLEIDEIEPNNINLSPSLLKKKIQK